MAAPKPKPKTRKAHKPGKNTRSQLEKLEGFKKSPPKKKK
jgi:hypothetical protein